MWDLTYNEYYLFPTQSSSFGPGTNIINFLFEFASTFFKFTSSFQVLSHKAWAINKGQTKSYLVSTKYSLLLTWNFIIERVWYFFNYSTSRYILIQDIEVQQYWYVGANLIASWVDVGVNLSLGYFQKSWTRVCDPLPKTLTLFMTKNLWFLLPFLCPRKNLAQLP